MTHSVSAIDDDRRIRSPRAAAPATGHRAGPAVATTAHSGPATSPAGHPAAHR